MEKEATLYTPETIPEYYKSINQELPPDTSYEVLEQLATQFNDKTFNKILQAPDKYLGSEEGKYLGNLAAGAAGLGLIGGVLGGARGAVVGTGLGAILGLIAKYFFGWDINKASNWLQGVINKPDAKKQLDNAMWHVAENPKASAQEKTIAQDTIAKTPATDPAVQKKLADKAGVPTAPETPREGVELLKSPYGKVEPPLETQKAEQELQATQARIQADRQQKAEDMPRGRAVPPPPQSLAELQAADKARAAQAAAAQAAEKQRLQAVYAARRDIGGVVSPPAHVQAEEAHQAQVQQRLAEMAEKSEPARGSSVQEQTQQRLADKVDKPRGSSVGLSPEALAMMEAKRNKRRAAEIAAKKTAVVKA